MKNQESTRTTSSEIHAQSVFAGFLIGGLAGAGAMLLLAPKSGRELRTQIAEKTGELRDRATGTLAETANLAQSKTQEIADDLRDKAGELNQQGRQLLARQLERVAAAAEAGGRAIEKS